MAKKCLLDANVLVALNWVSDPNHKKSRQVIKKIIDKKYQLVTNNYIVDEVLTVLLLRTKNLEQVGILASLLYSKQESILIKQVSPEWQKKASVVFVKQKTRQLSFTDCVLLVQAKEEKISTVCTFDQDMQKEDKLNQGLIFLP